MASKKTRRAIAPADVSRVLDDACTDRLAELLAHHGISPGASDEIEQHINWYRTGDSWRGQGRRIEVPPEFEQMREAAVALASHLRDVSIVQTVPDHFKDVERVSGGCDHFKLVGIDCVASIFFAAELIDAPQPDDQAIRDRLERMLSDLEDFANRITAAQRHGKHRGRKTDRAKHFVKMVASVLERDKGRPITRSENRVLKLLKDIADLVGIGPGTVEEVLKARSKRRRGEIFSRKR
jgi:hypothetical protein